MRLLIVNQYAITPALGGGTRHYEIASRLRDRGHDVIVLTSRFVHFTHRYDSERSAPHWWVRLWSTPYQTNVGPARLLSSIVFALHVLWWGVKHRRFDVVVGSVPDPFVAFAAYLVARAQHSRFVLEVRDLWPETLESMGVRIRPLLEVMRAAVNFMYRRADSVIVLTPGIQCSLSKRVRSGKVILIPNGVDVTPFESARSAWEVRKELGLDRQFVLIYAGSHTASYGLETILDAATLLREKRDILFCFMGDGPEKPRLQRIAADRGLDNVRFLDPVPKHRVADVLCAMDVCIESQAPQELFAGAMPNKLYDYLASDRPILCINRGDGWRLVEAAGAGIQCEPGNPEDIASAVQRLAQNPELVKRLSGKGRRFVKEKFNWNKLSEMFERAVTDV